MAEDDTDGTDIFDVDAETKPAPKSKPQPLYQVYEGSRIAVSRNVGTHWKQTMDYANAAYQPIWAVWDTIYKYYNFHHGNDQALETPRGPFKRGDSSENVIYSNTNMLLPAVYMKNPDFTFNTDDPEDEPLTKTLEKLINVLMRRKDKLHAKGKAKRAVGFAALTNFGVLKLDYVRKDDSRELAAEQAALLTDQLSKAKTPTEVQEIYGQLQALDENMEILEASGPKLLNVLPQNLIIDPYAEMPDGTDADWMIERMYMPTFKIQAKYTKQSRDPDDPGAKLIYKPTHEAVYTPGNGREREDGLGMVLTAIDNAGDVTMANSHEERMAYINRYYTECYLVWDKTTRRVMLFHRDDWAWPMWVWDDPLKLSRFFPYFLMAFSMSLGSTANVGDTAYVLDHQDEINDINRQVRKIRNTVFDFFFYNSDAINKSEAEQFVKALQGQGSATDTKLLAVRAGEKNIKDMIQAFAPPALEYEKLFNKDSIFNTIDRVTNTSDALRGVEFKTNTNEAAVNSYQDAARLSIGAKTDVVEETMQDVAHALCELCVQFMDQTEVENMIGKKNTLAWEEMTVADFNAHYSCEVVAGSTEKKNSIWKKKEAIEAAQAVGQFAQGAPASSLKIVLKLLSGAFSEVVVTKDDWSGIDQEMQQLATKGVSTPGGAPGTGANAPQGGGQINPDQIEQLLSQVPPEIKAQAAQMAQSGTPPMEILAFIQQAIGGGAAAPQPNAQAPQMPQ